MYIDDRQPNTIDLRAARAPSDAYADAGRVPTLDLRPVPKKETKYLFPKKKKPSTFFRVRKDVMSGVYRMAGVLLVTIAAWQAFPALTISLSYFTDTEASSVNTFRATAVDVNVTPDAVSASLSAGETVPFAPLTVSFVTTRGGTYDVHTVSAVGDACGGFTLGAEYSTFTFTPVSPSNLSLSNFTQGGQWTFMVTGAQDLAPGATCVVTIAFDATTGNFTDRALAVLTVETVSPLAPVSSDLVGAGLSARLSSPASVVGPGDEQTASEPSNEPASAEQTSEDATNPSGATTVLDDQTGAGSEAGQNTPEDEDTGDAEPESSTNAQEPVTQDN